VRLAVIARHRGIWPLAWLCETLQVTRGGFYAWLKRPESAHSRRDTQLTAAIRTCRGSISDYTSFGIYDRSPLMAKLVIILTIIGLAYWYWSGPYQKSTQTLEADRLKDNAAIIQRCVNQEQRMQSTGGLAGLADVGSTGVDAERLCAEKNNLYERDGNWYSRKD